MSLLRLFAAIAFVLYPKDVVVNSKHLKFGNHSPVTCTSPVPLLTCDYNVEVVRALGHSP